MEYNSRVGNAADESKQRKRSMRGPKSTCFKILTCSRKDPVEDDDDNSIISTPKTKALSDKRKRISHKQSTRGHQVPSNSTTLDLGFVHHSRESREEITSSDGFHSRKNSGFHSRKSSGSHSRKNSGSHSRKSSTIPENTLVQDIIKEPPPPLSSTFLNSDITVPTVQPDINPCVADERHLEKAVFTIQAAIRGYLARRELYKAKNAVKLQAAVRGHLVRRQAVGTLLCTHAICKVQALVRARRARQRSEGFAEDAKDEKLNMYMESPDLLEKRNTCNNLNRRYSSAVKLLSNGFARQLLESTTKIKPIYISCDPSKSDSAWKWLERWMAVTTSGWQHREHNFDDVFKEQEGSSMLSDHETGSDDISAAHSRTSTSEFDPSKSLLSNEDEEDSITKTSASCKFHSQVSFPNNCGSSSLGQDDRDKYQIKNDDIDMRQENDTDIEILDENSVSLTNQIQLHTGETSQLVPFSLCDKIDSNSDKVNNNRKTSCKSLETEGKGSRKPFDPAFATLQSNSEGLSSTSVVDKYVDLSYNDATNDSKLHVPHSLVDSSTKTKDLYFADNPLTHNPALAVTASEYGTETSISSTLDSHDFPKPEGGKTVPEVGSLEKQNSFGADISFIGNAEAEDPSSKLEVFQPERSVKEDTNLSHHSVSPDVPFIGNVEAKERSSKLEVLQTERLVNEDTNISNQKSVGDDVPLIVMAEAKDPSSELEVLQQERLVKEDANLSHQSVGADDPFIGSVEANAPSSELEVLQPERLQEEDTNLSDGKFVVADVSSILSDGKFVVADVSSIRNAEAEEPSSKLEVLAPERLNEEDTNLTNQKFVDSDVPHIGNAEAKVFPSKSEVFLPERPEEKERNLNQNFVDADVSYIVNATAEGPSSKLEILQLERLEDKDTSLHDHNFVGADVSFTGNAEVQDPQSKRLQRADTDNQNFVDADVSFSGNSKAEDPSSKLEVPEVLQPEMLKEKDRNPSDQNFVDADVSLSGNDEAEDPSSKLEVLQPERMEKEDTNLRNENFVDADISFNGNTEKEYPSSKGEVLRQERLKEEDKYQANENFVGANVSFIGNAEAEDLSSKSEVVMSVRSDEEDTDISSPASYIQHSPGSTVSDMQAQPENFVNQQVESTLPEKTPQSHTTTSELTGIPSNKVSVNSSKDKKDSGIRSGKQRFQTNKKPPPSNAKNDLNVRICMEQLEKDSKSAKRRNSFGTINYVDGDPEPGIRSSNSLPSYMQATKSAVAKVQTSISTKPSPDAHEKDNLVNKRHSLPLANGKQGFVASRVQQHELKGSGGTTYSRLNSTDRRWQR